MKGGEWGLTERLIRTSNKFLAVFVLTSCVVGSNTAEVKCAFYLLVVDNLYSIGSNLYSFSIRKQSSLVKFGELWVPSDRQRLKTRR